MKYFYIEPNKIHAALAACFQFYGKKWDQYSTALFDTKIYKLSKAVITNLLDLTDNWLVTADLKVYYLEEYFDE